MTTFAIDLCTAVDIHADTQTRVDIDIRVVEIGKADGRHDHEVVEVVLLVSRQLCPLPVAGDDIPSHFAHVHHSAERKPVFESVLVLYPDVLVMAVTLLVLVRRLRRHRPRDRRRVMPNEALEELIAPTDTNLVPTVHMIPFGL